MAQGDITISGRTRLLIDGGVLAALVAMAFYIGQWKSAQEESATYMASQIDALTSEVAALAARPITAEADRRLSVAEAQIATHAAMVAEMKVDLTKRLDRLEQQNAEILRELRRR